MSAIAGIFDLPADENIVRTLLDTMAVRGPDGNGSYQTQNGYILHSRLASAEPSGDGNPVVLDWGNERYVLSYNGRLYNGEQLRRELMCCGHHFDGDSDGEVVLHAYVQWQEHLLDKMNGVFAFAVLEERSGRVFLARDRIGVKPLFYMMHGGGIVFASEMKTILAFPGIQAAIDHDGAAQLLLLGPGRRPGSGVFKNMCELLPGHYAVYENRKLQIYRYWRLADREHTESFEETAAHVRQLVLDAIRQQMKADVPVGALLSGGLDSSLITAVCAREMDADGKRLRTFSLDYAGNDLYFQPGIFQPGSDTEYIRIMQSHLDTEHHWTVLRPVQLMEAMESATVARDLPGMADVDSSLLLFCEKIRPHVNVILSGECADEIFGGYPWFRETDDVGIEGFPWAKNLQQRISLMHPDLSCHLDGEEYVRSLYKQTINDCDILPENTDADRRMKQLVNLNFNWFMQTLLDRKDRMTMHHGLEARVPFCDYRIAEYIYSVPWSFKDYKGREKGLLRYAMEGFLPDCVLYRKKSPYPKTHDPAYLALARQKMMLLLEDQNAPLFHLVDRSAVVKMMSREFERPWYGQLMQLPQTLVYLLQINYWLNHYSVQFQ
ncbi:MAG: asparagine synthase (glutamine-hydrolyzing) [Ruminococcaceae bacterium]|nr:asparagine synthase (glutamine-hydrolyzing) [Oscillospiraceae bacterium]